MIKQIFVNLPVNDLEKTKQFWTALGFSFNPQFTDQNAAALVLSENIFVMLLVQPFFKQFTKKEISDATKSTEVINALSVDSRAEADKMMEMVIAAGGREVRSAEDHGWMYSRSFQDVDGHQWEVFYGDVSQAPAHPGEASHS